MTDKEIDITEFNKRRQDYMADDTPIELGDVPKLLEIANKLREEDTSLNLYELQKHPDVRAKLFEQITDACYMMLEVEPTDSQRLVLYNYLESQFIKTLGKQASRTNLNQLNQFLNIVKKERKDVDLRELAMDLVNIGLFEEETIEDKEIDHLSQEMELLKEVEADE